MKVIQNGEFGNTIHSHASIQTRCATPSVFRRRCGDVPLAFVSVPPTYAYVIPSANTIK